MITSGKIKRPRRTFVFGVPGVGKSTWASQWPGAIFLPTEQGSDDLDVKRFPLIKSYATLMEHIGLLYAEEHDFRTVVIDTLDALERLIHADVCKAAMKESIRDFDFGQGYDRAMPAWKTFMQACDSLVGKGMNVVLVAHCTAEKFEDPTTDSYHRYAPKVHRTAAEPLMEWCDEVLFCGYRVNTTDVDEGFNRKRARAIGTGERLMWTQQRPAHRAKNRLGLPEVLPLDFVKYDVYLQRDDGKNKSHPVKGQR